ncbi:hypothetical protein PO909_011904 [Leuciscus waleckii]
MWYWDMEMMLRHETITVTLKNKEGKQKNRLMRRCQGLRRVGSAERTRPGPVPQCLRDPTQTATAPLAFRMNRGLQTPVH